MKEDIVLDEVDQAIIDLLRRDGRATNQQVAEQIGLTPSTVSIRIRRMEKANKLRVVAVSDFSAHGINLLMPLAIEVQGRPVIDVANDLLEFSEIFALHLVSGPHDIDALLALQTSEDTAEFVLEKLSRVEGIRSVDLSIAVDVLKYKFDIAPIHQIGERAGTDKFSTNSTIG